MMAASAMQLALRSFGAKGKTFNDEVKDLAAKGILPPIMVEWADEVRWLRNPATHPQPGQEPTDPKDATDVVRFLGYLLEYLLDLPHQINEYRERRAAEEAEAAEDTEIIEEG